MIKETTKSSNGTSFHDDTIRASLTILKTILGEPQIIQNSKVAFEWTKEIDGEVFTVYDWKEEYFFDDEYSFDDDLIDWHIGAHNAETSKKAKAKLEELILKVKTIYILQNMKDLEQWEVFKTLQEAEDARDTWLYYLSPDKRDEEGKKWVIITKQI